MWSRAGERVSGNITSLLVLLCCTQPRRTQVKVGATPLSHPSAAVATIPDSWNDEGGWNLGWSFKGRSSPLYHKKLALCVTHLIRYRQSLDFWPEETRDVRNRLLLESLISIRQPRHAGLVIQELPSSSDYIKVRTTSL